MSSKLLLFICLTVGGWGCSLARTSAMNQVASVAYQNAKSLENESNWEMFRTGVPGNLQLLESLLASSPQNRDLLAALAKGYTSYAYLVDETQSLGDLLLGKDTSPQAILNYSKGIAYGVRYLALKKINYSDLISAAQVPDGITKLLSARLSARQVRDLDVVFFTAQGMMGLVNFRKNDLALVAQVPIAKGLLDWACGVKKDLYYGACGIFYGAYESSRPAFFGGNPEKGKAIFLETIHNFPENPLARMAFIQYFLAPQLDYQGFLEQKSWFDRQEKSFVVDHIWNPPLPLKNSQAGDKTSAPAPQEGLNLFQQSAAKKFAILRKYEQEIFFRRKSL